MMYVLSMLLKCINLCYINNQISAFVASCLKNILHISFTYLKQDVERGDGEIVLREMDVAVIYQR